MTEKEEALKATLNFIIDKLKEILDTLDSAA